MSSADAILGPLDAGRAHLLRWVGPFAAPLLGDREARVGLSGAAAVVGALAITCVAPRWVLSYGPLFWGVPHIVADLRYLVVRTSLYRRWRFWMGLGLPVAMAGLCGHAWVGLLAPFGAGIVARAAAWKKALAVAAWATLCVWARRSGPLAELALAHGHNLVAVAIFWAWSRRRRRHHWAALGVFVAGLCFLGSGAVDGLFLPWIGGRAASGHATEFAALVRELAPLGNIHWAVRLTLAFAFAQSVHYAVWLRLIPEEDRPRPGLRSFASSLQALKLDMGMRSVVAACVGTALLIGWGLVRPAAARHAYLRVGGFHSSLELAVVTLLALEGRFPLRVRR